jgi:prophage regulatory protein
MPDLGEFTDAVERASKSAVKVVLDIKGVIELTALGQTTIYELARDGKFPRQRKFGSQRVTWLRSEVVDWIDQQFARGNTEADRPNQRANAAQPQFPTPERRGRPPLGVERAANASDWTRGDLLRGR